MDELIIPIVFFVAIIILTWHEGRERGRDEERKRRKELEDKWMN